MRKAIFRKVRDLETYNEALQSQLNRVNERRSLDTLVRETARIECDKLLNDIRETLYFTRSHELSELYAELYKVQENRDNERRQGL